MKILIIGNCQGDLLLDIFKCIIPGVNLEFVRIQNFDMSSMESLDLNVYQAIFIQNFSEQKTLILNEALEGFNNVFYFPKIVFSGYHPDFIYVFNKNTGESYNAHSNIVFNAYRRGLTKGEVRHLFSKDFISKLNYDSLFGATRDWLVNNINECGMDGRFLFDKWASTSTFMFTINHPKLFVMEDIAKELCIKSKIHFVDLPVEEYVNNTLKSSPMFPIFDSLASKNSITSTEHVYFVNKKCLTLDTFISESYKFYDSSFLDLEINDSRAKIFDTALEEFKDISSKSSLAQNHISKNPYHKLPAVNFWKKSVAQKEIESVAPLVELNPIISSVTKVATAGSCFAQHIARTLAKNGLNYYVAEQIPQGLTDEIAQLRGYDLFSARYGNIYTARQLVQLFKRAYGQFVPVEQTWLAKSGQYIDPFRPNIGEEFKTEAKLIAQRDIHLAAVREMFENLDVFVFTLGLTESWLNTHDGAVYPVAPGVVSQHSNYSNYVFKNFTHEETREDMIEFLGLLRSVNRGAKVLLTVSPVPLIATYEDEHVLSATTYSKSVLRAVAGELTKAFELVSYFPSYEIITGSFNKGAYYENDLRSVKPEGVAHVMGVFMDYMVADADITPASKKQNENVVDSSLLAEIKRNADIVCDEELIESE